ncbi:hypothetical protein PCASD_25123 [Puccinia coronata f. sp. avenae]|uniref:Uncharacterized protein n=1 Tax=Puccinia coronata f. sp. avenae TaxID=200324 RepID=A0A2N5TND9_9BASI|nr:hypothetical protein PCASD_25123 [Puccinia coronata f. sp. avenae]
MAVSAVRVNALRLTDFMSAGPTDTLEQRNNVSVGPADVTSVYKTDVTSVAATDLAAGGCNRYNPFGGADKYYHQQPDAADAFDSEHASGLSNSDEAGA